uniref:DUF4238 domain-containing protein n=1 Tax=Steinernema glaseri TaxID=37863 RepID=A0A1I8A6Y8_9BILA
MLFDDIFPLCNTYESISPMKTNVLYLSERSYALAESIRRVDIRKERILSIPFARSLVIPSDARIPPLASDLWRIMLRDDGSQYIVSFPA